jgi:hypothetical protein
MFIINWVFDKLGYIPKIDVQVGKVQIDTQAPDFKMWPFPVEEPKKRAVKKTRALPSKATIAKKTTTRKPKAK